MICKWVLDFLHWKGISEHFGERHRQILLGRGEAHTLGRQKMGIREAPCDWGFQMCVCVSLEASFMMWGLRYFVEKSSNPLNLLIHFEIKFLPFSLSMGLIYELRISLKHLM